MMDKQNVFKFVKISATIQNDITNHKNLILNCTQEDSIAHGFGFYLYQRIIFEKRRPFPVI